MPARFGARRASGGHIEGLYLRSVSTNEWLVLLKPSRRLRVGETIDLAGTRARLHLAESLDGGEWRIRIDPSRPAHELLDEIGWTPLPPYIKRPHDVPDARQADAVDRRRYQTVYARQPGAVAAPTAGLHLTENTLDALHSAGVTTAAVTLHVGLGTFEPIKAPRLADHRMHTEWYELSEQTAATIERTRAGGGRIFAVGTTSARVLETCATPDGQVRAGSGTTDIFIYPPYRFRAVDAMLTNFHLPGSTLLAMVFAFAGRDRILTAYARAVQLGMRFYSYGDAMLIL